MSPVLCLFTGLALTAASLLVNVTSAIGQEERPESLDPRLKIELFAEAPQIVTPTGIDVDLSGRVWAIESNTHFPPDDYKGHATDRILVMEDTDKDGKADKIVVFKDGLTHSMSIAVKPVWLDPASIGELPTTVYIATRREIFLCQDTDGDLKCDQFKSIVHLETTGNYPHNGLAGFAFDREGYMFFGFGENLGADYKIIGSDGTTLSGGGEGGNVYRCRPDGSKLERWATGFWNPHASCFDAFGRLFTLDNDPDSRPPCRLLHIIQHGDYGYRFRNGRKGTHPFTAWNGEIPGTLPMVSGTGEAPSGIVCYESDGFPKDYIGTLLVGSWGDHRIDQFVLKPRGTSFESIPKPIIKGEENFRPVGLAIAPDGSMYATDWVSKEYKLHGLGRIWRISAKGTSHAPTVSLKDIPQEKSAAKLVKLLESPGLPVRRLAAMRLAKLPDGLKALDSISSEMPAVQKERLVYELTGMKPSSNPPKPSGPSLEGLDLIDPFVMSEAIAGLATSSPSADSLHQLLQHVQSLQDKGYVEQRPRELELHQIAVLLASRWVYPKDASFPKAALSAPFPSIRRLAVQWVGEEKLSDLRPDIERVLASEPMTNDLFTACLASLSLLDGVAPAVFERTPPAEYILAIIKDTSRSSSLRAIALRILPPSQKELNAQLLGEMLSSKDPALQREAVRTLQQSPIAERNELLRPIAADTKLDASLRADAVAGLTSSNAQAPVDQSTQDLLIQLAQNETNIPLRLEAIRSLRTAASNGTSKQENQGLVEALNSVLSNAKDQPESIQNKLRDAVSLSLGNREPISAKTLLSELSEAKSGSATPEQIESGRRTFFHVNAAGCYKCHAVGGRGGQVGPDLTVIARTMDRKKLAESILEPSKEISPQFTTWAIETTEGKVLTGNLLGEEVNGDLRLANNQGEVFFVPFKNIASRTPLKTSIMPEKLHELLTPDEFRDLIAFLETLK